MKIYIGTSGWSYFHWKERFYPKDLLMKDWLNYYSKFFKTVEINSTFYNWPTDLAVKRWYKNSPKDFKFTLKAQRIITHIKRINNVKMEVENLYRIGKILNKKIACFLFQLPPSYKFNKENFSRLKQFIKLLNKKNKNVIEFREKNWWNKEVYSLLQKNKISFCTVSGLNMPEEIVVTSNVAYFRFHGERYSTDYPIDEIKKFSNNIKKLKELKVKECYCYFDNDKNAYAIKNANELIKELK